MPKERDIVKQIKDYCKEQGMYIIKQHGSQFAELGTPDLIFCWMGSFYAAEIKVPGKKPTPIQIQRINEIKKAGGVAFWCTSLQEFKDKIK